MKAIRFAVVLGGLILTAGLGPVAQVAQAQDKPKDLIIGKWESADPKKPAVEKGIIEFTKEGKVKLTAGPVSVDGTYKFIDEKTLELTIGDMTEKLTVAVTKDELTATDSKNKTDKLKRVK